MHDLKKLFLFLAVISLFSSGIVSTAPAFADDDDDEKKKDKNKDKITKLQKECAKEPKKPYKIKPECELLNLINDSAPDPRADSFFDVFFDVESYSVDSFFDIFTELQTSSSRADSFFDVFFDVESYSVDSFFDIFTELQTDVDTIETEIVALDLRGESCPDGEILTGIAADGTLVCTISGEGGNPFGDLQSQIDDKNSEILQIQNDIASVKSGIANFQNQLNAIALSSQQILQCQQQCASLKASQQLQLQQCAFEASQLGIAVETHCSAEITALDTPCLCPTTSDPVLAEQLEQQIELLNSELALLEEKLEDCQFELMVLQTLQNQFNDSSEPPLDCDDGNICTINFFDSTSASCVTLPNDGLSCNDGDITTQNDMCTVSMCVGTPIICDDNNSDTTDVIDSITGQCIFTLIDNDNDGFGPSVDCNDDDSAINPNAIEVVGDNVDNNCDGITDNLPPIVNAGLDQTSSRGGQDSCVATFVGTSSDPDNDPLTLQWTTSTFGSSITIDSPNSLITDVTFTPHRITGSFTATLELSTSDGLHSVSDTVRFTCN